MKSKKFIFAVISIGLITVYFCGYFLLVTWDHGNPRMPDLVGPGEETLFTIYQPLLEMSMSHHAKIREMNIPGRWLDAATGMSIRITEERDVEVSGFDKYGIQDGSKARGKPGARGWFFVDGLDGGSFPDGVRLVLDTWDKKSLLVRIPPLPKKAVKQDEFHLAQLTES